MRNIIKEIMENMFITPQTLLSVAIHALAEVPAPERCGQCGQPIARPLCNSCGSGAALE